VSDYNEAAESFRDGLRIAGLFYAASEALYEIDVNVPGSDGNWEGWKGTNIKNVLALLNTADEMIKALLIEFAKLPDGPLPPELVEEMKQK